MSLAEGCDQLYYLHARCVHAYKRLHGLQSVEGRISLRRPGAAMSDTSTGTGTTTR